MADELPLPKLPFNASTQTLNSRRKRLRFSSPPIVSSDPPIFSSDDDPSVDNYTQERRKRTYRGPWYQQRPAEEAGDLQEQQLPRRRIFERQYDSGVFMGSDVTENEDGEGTELGGPSELPFRQPFANQGTKPSLSPEDLVQKEIARCIEDGVESIDLSSRGLTSLSNATIRPLTTFTRVPVVTEGVFTKLEPKLKLFLQRNELTALPGELFNLDSLTVLSLRANQLDEVPPGIGKLKGLKELSLSQNGLRYLPFEILDLLSDNTRLQSLQLHPNHFHEPDLPNPEPKLDGVSDEQYKIGLSSPATGRRGAVSAGSISDFRNLRFAVSWEVSYQARTEVRFLDHFGALLQGPQFPGVVPDESKHQKIPIAHENDIPKPPKSTGCSVSHVRSLYETALAACARSSQLPHLSKYLTDGCPRHMEEALALAEAKKESGGSKCTVCGRDFIVPRTEWIEWWQISKVPSRSTISAASPLRQRENKRDKSESMVPLMRRGCSWLCVPNKAPLQEDTVQMEE